MEFWEIVAVVGGFAIIIGHWIEDVIERRRRARLGPVKMLDLTGK
jgi:hypothetical protein